ncbi:collagen alpha-1(X) chain-like [Saccostrea cucullata]|uniref:collagen alpha-1(X) chain-like n=1 Tax=Saccostrea cuccullata TaxID=36930 RepID=UPI002ED4A7FD
MERVLDEWNITLTEKVRDLEMNTQKKIHDMEKMMRQVLLTVNQMDVKLENSDVHNMSLEIEKLKKEGFNHVKNSTDIGFTARLGGTYSRSDIIKAYNSPIFNYGNAYNGSVFTCPIQGLYLFQVSLISNTAGDGVFIYKNGHQLILAYTSERSQGLNSGSVSLVINLDIGDQVYLLPNSGSLRVDGESVFTGVKIN